MTTRAGTDISHVPCCFRRLLPLCALGACEQQAAIRRSVGCIQARNRGLKVLHIIQAAVRLYGMERTTLLTIRHLMARGDEIELAVICEPEMRKTDRIAGAAQEAGIPVRRWPSHAEDFPGWNTESWAPQGVENTGAGFRR